MTDELLEKVITVIINSSPSHVGYRGLRTGVLSELRQEQEKRSNPLQTWEDLARAAPDVVFVPAAGFDDVNIEASEALNDCFLVHREKARRERDGLPPLTMVYVGVNRFRRMQKYTVNLWPKSEEPADGRVLAVFGAPLRVLDSHPDYFGFEPPSNAT